jgi:hypothetical protein
MAKPNKKKRVTSITIRENRKIDRSPRWEHTDELSKEEFLKLWHTAAQYYNLELQQKDYKSIIVTWMGYAEFPDDVISVFKKVKDWRCNSTMACIADGLMKGLPDNRTDFSNTNFPEWLSTKVYEIIQDHINDDEEANDTPSIPTPVVNIQDRTREIAIAMTDSFDGMIDAWTLNPKDFKSTNVSAILKVKEVKPVHAKYIIEFYTPEMAEIRTVLDGDAALKEGYQKYTKKQLESLYNFYNEIIAACNNLINESKPVKKVKPIDKNKMISKLKYKKTDDILKLTSIDPVNIVGASQLWVFDTKTRKIGCYIADSDVGLSIKGCTVLGYSIENSVQKILRKPSTSLNEFSKAGKIKLQSFLNDITATETQLSGRIGDNIILLKV